MDERKVKHLEFIQANISRMGQNSFQMKAWSITLVSALSALVISSGDNFSENINLILIGVLATIIFWVLDSYYLQQERKFRAIYNDVAEISDTSKRIEIKLFEMPLNKYKGWEYNLLRIMFSPTEWTLYLSIIVIVTTIFFVGGN